MSEAEAQVAVVILNWNNPEETAACLSSIESLPSDQFHTYVVDNGSTDNSASLLTKRFPTVDLIENEENLGFAGGNNVAIRNALSEDFDFIFLLNNDVKVPDPDVATRLLTVMKENPSIGILSPLVKESAKGPVWFEKGYINWTTGFAGHTTVDTTDIDLVKTEYVPFASAMIRTDVFNQLGLLPEEYFLYYEDADYCLTVRENAYKVMTDRSCEVYHKVSSSAGKTHGPIASYYIARNRWIFMRRHSERANPSFYFYYVYWALSRFVYRIYLREYAGASSFLRGVIDALRGINGRGPYP